MSIDAPTISVTNDGTGTSLTATVLADEGAEVTLLLRRSGVSAWTAGGSVVITTEGQSETIQQTGLDYGIYQVLAVAELSGDRSLPSRSLYLRVHSPDAETTPNRGPLRAMANLRDDIADTTTWQSWTNAGSALEAAQRIYLFGVDPPRPWRAEDAYDLHETTAPAHSGGSSTSPFLFSVTTDGTSGSEEPDWTQDDDSIATVAGSTITDGSVIWTARAIPEGGTPENTAVQLQRPFIVVIRPETYGGDAGMGGEVGLGGSQLRLYLEADIPAAYTATVQTAGIWFSRRCSELVVDLLHLIGRPGHLAARSVRLTDMMRSHGQERTARGDFAHAIVEVSF